MIVEPLYRGYRIEVHAERVDGAWDATVRIRRVFTDDKPHVERVTCRKVSAELAETRAGDLCAAVGGSQRVGAGLGALGRGGHCAGDYCAKIWLARLIGDRRGGVAATPACRQAPRCCGR
jgi:hypothetical protein